MRIGTLETGAPPAELRAAFGSYGEMFARLLGGSYSYVNFDVCRGNYPSGGDCDTCIVTGSPAGVHDGHVWIDTLKGFLQEIAGRVPLIGVCFGHQLMAEAFGGRVARSPKGWGIGLHSYEVR